MNSLTRWNPFRQLSSLEERMDRIFGSLLGPPPHGGKESMSVAHWAPAVDITEDDKEFLIKAELPELKKEDVKVSVENGVLSISGERKLEQEEKGKTYHRIERSYGSFLRSFSLPDGVDASRVSAEFKDGLLSVRLPKDAKVKPKAVDIKVQ